MKDYFENIVIVLLIILGILGKLYEKISASSKKEESTTDESLPQQQSVPKPLVRQKQSMGRPYNYQTTVDNIHYSLIKEDSFDVSTTKSDAIESIETKTDQTTRPNDFDLRQAVIYSEILTPKFKENE